MIDAHLLKATIRANILSLCKALYPNGRKICHEWRIGDVYGDTGDSLGIQLVGSKAGLFNDRAAGEHGDFVKLLQLHFGFGYREAADWVGRTLGTSFEVSDSDSEASERKKEEQPGSVPVDLVKKEDRNEARIESKEEPPAILSPAARKRMALAAHVLSLEPRLFYTVLGQRPEISLEAVCGCALEGDLGFEADYQYKSLRGPAVLFGYRYGIKVRYRAWPNGNRPIVWEGKPAGECWRQSLLRKDHETIYISEGETDVLTGLSLGVEDDDSPSLVVGLASATILPKPLPFAGRSIVILSDPDTAGAGAAEKLAEVFSSVAAEVAIVSLGTDVEGGVR
jgi:hypothetical protein